MKLRIATRRSALALAQTRAVARAIAAASPGIAIEEVPIVTEGDRVQDRSLAAIGGKGLFVTELEAALLDGRADLAVHSMKDLPAVLAGGLEIVCVPQRESPWDLLVTLDGRELSSLPNGARIGTSSVRRKMQLQAVRSDLRFELLRGNVDTRIRRLEAGAFDAIVLAEAGVRRLGLTVKGWGLGPLVVPAIGQGALALEARRDDSAVAECVRTLNDSVSAVATRAERAVLLALGGSCVAPIGAIAECDGARLAMRGFFADDDASRSARASVSADASDPEAAGALLASALRARLG